MKKTEALRQAYGDELFSRIEFIVADLEDAAGLSNAISGVTHMLHLASPVPSDANKYAKKQMTKQAVRGMRIVLEACKANRVQKLVITSSADTIATGIPSKAKSQEFDENDYNYAVTDKDVDDYIMSKIMQE